MLVEPGAQVASVVSLLIDSAGQLADPLLVLGGVAEEDVIHHERPAESRIRKSLEGLATAGSPPPG